MIGIIALIACQTFNQATSHSKYLSTYLSCVNFSSLEQNFGNKELILKFFYY